jgi:hypothetical protein
VPAGSLGGASTGINKQHPNVKYSTIVCWSARLRQTGARQQGHHDNAECCMFLFRPLILRYFMGTASLRLTALVVIASAAIRPKREKIQGTILKNFFPLRQGCHIFDTRWSHFQN